MLRRALLPSAALLAACSSAPEARVVTGESFTPSARTAMSEGGVVFAPFMELHALGAEATDEHYRCIDAVNRTVADRLASRYAVRPGSPAVDPRTRQPGWMLGPGGPRVAVHVEAFRCGRVVGDPGFVAAKFFSEEPATDGTAVVILTVHDRTSGSTVVQIRGEAKEANGVAAVVAAAGAAVDYLVPPAD